ncbi:hypothetical protein RCL1_008890 [Eukaryota sp. TZLM3-RCL]
MIKHVVMFKLKEGTEENKNKLRDVILSMQGKIEVLRHLEVGSNVVPSARAYDVVLVSHFDNLDDLQVYIKHPEHQKILPDILGLAENIAAVDYEL